MNSTSTIDKYIKISANMIADSVVLACGINVAMYVMITRGMNVIILLPVSYLLILNAARKLFYTSLYGQEAMMYQSLPVSAEEIVLGKTFVMTAASTIYIMIILICSLASAVLSGQYEYMGSFDLPEFVAALWGIEYLNPFDIPYILTLGIGGFITGQFRFWILLFFGIAWYNSLPDSKKGGLAKLAALVTIIGTEAGLEYMVRKITEMSGSIYWPPAEIAGIVSDIIIAIILYRATLKLVGTRYNLAQGVT